MDDPTGSEKLRRPGVALVLSLLTVGLGQLYSTRPGRAAFFYGAYLVLSILYVSTPVAYSLAGSVVSAVVAVCFAVFHLSDAWRTAKRVGVVPLRRYNRRSVYTLIVMANLVLAWVLPTPIEAYRIPTSGMQPALQVGDHIIADRHFSRAGLKRGDVVVFSHPTERKLFIKRVIGLPGETIETRGSEVLIDGRVMDDPWGVYRGSVPIGDVGPIFVPAGAYFVVGDHRNNSWDSRQWGCLPAKFIKAKPLYIYWARDRGRIGKPVQ